MNADRYFTEGCGRCPLGGTPDCKVHRWEAELRLLRRIILDCELNEELKWGMPCYTFEKKNVALLAAFKEYCSLSFFKGALLSDPHGLLIQPGESSQAARQLRFYHVGEIETREPLIKEYIHAAVEVEKAGLQVEFRPNPEPIPIEFQQKLESDPALNAAFYALTPGRRRGYIIYFSAPKGSQARERRIEKCLPRIFEGKGLSD